MTVEFEVTGTIPVAQFSNIQPRFTVTGADLSEARDIGLAEMQKIFRTVNPNLNSSWLNNADPPKLEWQTHTCALSGSEILFEPLTHTYGPGDWLSGSTFAGQFENEFQGEIVSGKLAAKSGVPAQTIMDMWTTNAEASSLYGSAVHAALELYGKYRDTSLAVKGTLESALHKNPALAKPVELFFEGRDNERALYEPVLVHEPSKRCGFVDRLLKVGEKTVRIQDFKTNTDIHKKVTVKPTFRGEIPSTTLGIYYLQLSFYAWIAVQHGWTVDGLDVFWWSGDKWEAFSHEVVDVSEGF